VDFGQSNHNIMEHFKDLKKQAILPGFIASDADGETTTLGRGGSDYTAAIVAAALEAKVLEIWTDVDGFMTADPRIGPQSLHGRLHELRGGHGAFPFWGEGDLYPHTYPGLQGRHPHPGEKYLQSRSRRHPDHRWQPLRKNELIKGISSIDYVSLVTVKGTGMVGKTGTSARVFNSLAGAQVECDPDHPGFL
jgi:aspartokinase/homoserine dehydrogenase 1